MSLTWEYPLAIEVILFFMQHLQRIMKFPFSLYIIFFPQKNNDWTSDTFAG